MKEAAGEANMTVITIVLIGIVAAAGAIIIPRMLNGSSEQSKCANRGNVWYNGACYTPDQCKQDANSLKFSCSGTPSNIVGGTKN